MAKIFQYGPVKAEVDHIGTSWSALHKENVEKYRVKLNDDKGSKFEAVASLDEGRKDDHAFAAGLVIYDLAAIVEDGKVAAFAKLFQPEVYRAAIKFGENATLAEDAVAEEMF